MATGYTSKELVKRELPPLRLSGQRTGSISQSNQMFIGNMDRWRDFEQEVRALTKSHEWPEHHVTWEKPDTPSLHEEQILVATEKGVLSRFQHQVGHIMTYVGFDTDVKLRFGDWHGSSDFIPDITIWNANNTALVAGEIKTPWTVDLGAIMAREESNHELFHQQFDRTFGQVTNYMEVHGYKYAFMTTYEWTVFLKREPFTFDEAFATANNTEEKTVSILRYSDPISYNTRSVGVDPRHENNPLAYKNKVSLRECMFFLMKKLENDHSYPHDRREWTKPRTGHMAKNEKAKILKYPSQSSQSKNPSSAGKSKGESSGTGKKPSKGKGKAREDRDHYHINPADSLAGKMSGLQLKVTQSSKELPVRWSSKNNTFMYTSNGNPLEVEKWKRENGQIFVLVKGVKYPALVKA